MTLRIRDWDKHFENNRTRELKKLSWVPFPNKHDGDGYTELVDHKDGVAHFGCWCLICEVASKCDPRGTLLRDDKTPHTFETIARMTRASATDMRSAIERLISIGWIESCDNPAPSCDLIPHPPAQKGMEGNGRELNRKEEKNTPLVSLADFDSFWNAYPRKVGKQSALKAWNKATKKPALPAILSAIEVQKQSEQWTKDGGQFIPHPATWLNAGRWDDETPVVEQRRIGHL